LIGHRLRMVLPVPSPLRELRAGRRQNRSCGAILGKKAVRPKAEWRWIGEAETGEGPASAHQDYPPSTEIHASRPERTARCASGPHRFRRQTMVIPGSSTSNSRSSSSASHPRNVTPAHAGAQYTPALRCQPCQSRTPFAYWIPSSDGMTAGGVEKLGLAVAHPQFIKTPIHSDACQKSSRTYPRSFQLH